MFSSEEESPIKENAIEGISKIREMANGIEDICSPVGSPYDSSISASSKKFLELKKMLEEDQARQAPSTSACEESKVKASRLCHETRDIQDIDANIDSGGFDAFESEDMETSAKLYEQLHERDMKIIELQARLKEYDQELADAKDEVEEKKKLMQSKREAFIVVENKLKSEIEKRNMELERTQTTLFDIEKNFESLESRLKKDNIELKSKVKELSDEITSLNQKNSDLENQKTECASTAEDLKNKVEEYKALERRNQEYEYELEILKERMLESEKKEADLLQWKIKFEEISQLKEEITKKYEEKLAADEETQNNKLNEVNAALVASQEKFQKLKMQYQMKLKHLKDQQQNSQKENELQEQVTKLENKIAELEEEKGNLLLQSVHAEEAYATVETCKLEIGKLESCAEEKDNAIKSLMEQIQQLSSSPPKEDEKLMESEILMKDAKIEELERELAALQAGKEIDLEETERQTESYKTEISELKSNLQKSEEKFVKLRQQYQTKLKQLKDKQKEMAEEPQAKITELQNRLAELEEEKGNLLLRLVDYDEQQAESRNRSELDAIVANKDEEIKVIQDKINELGLSSLGPSKDISELRDKCSGLEKLLEDKELELRELRSSKDAEIQSTIDTYVQYLKQAETQVVDLERILAEKERNSSSNVDLEEMRRLFSDKEKEIEALQGSLKESCLSKEELIEQLKAKEWELDEATVKHESEMKELENQNNAFKIQLSENNKLFNLDREEYAAALKTKDSNLAEKNIEINELMSNISRLNNEIVLIKQEFEQSFESVKSELESNILHKDEEISKLKLFVEEQALQYQAKEDELKNYKVSNEQFSLDVEEYDRIKSQMASLQEEINTKDVLIGNKDLEINNLRSLLSSKEDELITIKQTAENHVAVSQQLMCQLQSKDNDFEEFNRQLTGRINTLEEEARGMVSREIINEVTTENQRLRERLMLAEQEIQQLQTVRTEKQNLSIENDLLSNTIKTLEHTCSDFDTAKEKLNNLLEEKSKLENLVQDLKQEVSKADSYSARTMELSEEKEKLLSSIEVMKQDVAKLVIEKEELSSKVEELLAARDTMERELKDVIKSKTEELNRANRHLKDSQDQIEKQAHEIAELNHKCLETNETASQFYNQSEKTMQDILQRDSIIQDKNSECSQLRDKIAAYKKDIESRDMEINKLENQLMEVQFVNEGLRREVSEAHESEEKDEKIMELTSNIETLEASLVEMTKEIEREASLSKELSQVKMELIEKCDAINNQVSDLASKNEQLLNERLNLCEQVRQNSLEIQALSTERDNLSYELNNMVASQNKLEASNIIYQTDVEELNNSIKMKDEEIESLMNEMNSMAGDVGISSDEKNALEHKIELLHSKLSEVESSEIKCVEECIMLKSWARQLEQRNTKLQEDMDKMYESVAEGHGNMAKVKTLSHEILRLINTLQDRDKRCEQLAVQIAEYLEEKDKLERKVLELENKIQPEELPDNQNQGCTEERAIKKSLNQKISDLEKQNFYLSLDLKREKRVKQILQEQLFFSQSSTIFQPQQGLSLGPTSTGSRSPTPSSPFTPKTPVKNPSPGLPPTPNTPP